MLTPILFAGIPKEDLYFLALSYYSDYFSEINNAMYWKTGHDGWAARERLLLTTHVSD